MWFTIQSTDGFITQRGSQQTSHPTFQSTQVLLTCGCSHHWGPSLGAWDQSWHNTLWVLWEGRGCVRTEGVSPAYMIRRYPINSHFFTVGFPGFLFFKTFFIPLFFSICYLQYLSFTCHKATVALGETEWLMWLFFGTDFIYTMRFLHSGRENVVWGWKIPAPSCSSLFESSSNSMKWLGVYKGLEKITSF